MDIIVILVVAVIVGVLGFAVGYFLQSRVFTAKQVELETQRAEADKKLVEADAQAKDIILKAKDQALGIRNEQEADNKRTRAELSREEDQLRQRREAMDKRLEQIENRSRKLENREKEAERAKARMDELESKKLQEVQRVAQMSSDEAKQILLQAVEKDTRQDAARIIREIEATAREEGERRAREILTTAIERVASDQVVESTVSLVPLPSDEMKGRIIGKQGRNIRSIEMLTGVDLVVDDTPEAVIISSHNPIRREVARVSLQKLISDGRIHPGRIEKIVESAEEEVNKSIVEAGEAAVLETGIGGLHPELIKMLGSLKFRTSYGQNVLAHVVETSYLAGMIAAELKADVKAAKMGALLHDIGKAVTHEVGGAHAIIGAEYARKYGVPENVCNMIAAHHGEVEPKSVEAVLVTAADAISGARPGARRESLEQYLKRVEALEGMANAMPGVQQSYAIQAGRELRIIVKPEQIDDLSAINLSKMIARKIEENLEYPGQIKVTVIREQRAVEFAK
ncbi:MAG: ribonuclease Y [Chloroflexota bacterium]|nr:MAG: ribonuclease Y [Chloroflexota bacterium]